MLTMSPWSSSREGQLLLATGICVFLGRCLQTWDILPATIQNEGLPGLCSSAKNKVCGQVHEAAAAAASLAQAARLDPISCASL